MEGPTSRGDVVLAVLAYVPPLFLLALARRAKSRFLLYHTRQGLYVFSLFLVLFAVFLGLFYVFHFVAKVPLVENVLAVLVVLTFALYLVLVVGMMVKTARREMPMLPVLGDLAGER